MALGGRQEPPDLGGSQEVAMAYFYEVSIGGEIVARFKDPNHAEAYAEMLARESRGVAVGRVEREEI